MTTDEATKPAYLRVSDIFVASAATTLPEDVKRELRAKTGLIDPETLRLCVPMNEVVG